MKAGSNTDPKPASGETGIDFLRVLQIGGGIIGAVIVVWLIFHAVLHVI
jgi:hypothetical protein